MQTLGNILLVGAGGFAGSVLRYLVSLGLRGASGEWKWPLATFSVNLVGSILIGLLWGKSIQVAEPRLWLTLGTAGFCGGFTTFSAFSLEILELLKGGEYTVALLYVAASVVVCVAGVWLGMMLVKG